MRVAYVWALLGLVADAGGLLVDPHRLQNAPSWGLGIAPDYPEAATTPLGYVHLTITLILGVASLVPVVRRARAEPDLGLVVAAIFACVAAGGHDLLVRLARLRSVYLVEHVGLLAVLAMSYVLLRRFVRTSNELAARTRELGTSYDELRRAQQKLVHREQLAAVGELSAVIAHEVRNPLAIIKNAISGLRRRALPADDRETLVGILHEETDRLDRLVRDLMAYARPAAGRRERVDVRPLVERAVEMARAGATRSDRVVFDVRIEDVHGGIPGDADLLHRAIVNIVDNAIQAMPIGGAISIWSEKASLHGYAALRISVRDTGEGMDTLVRERARNPFFTTRPTGTGLGLAIVERIVRTHGGELEIKSRYGGGTTVTMILPAEEDDCRA